MPLHSGVMFCCRFRNGVCFINKRYTYHLLFVASFKKHDAHPPFFPPQNVCTETDPTKTPQRKFSIK